MKRSGAYAFLRRDRRCLPLPLVTARRVARSLPVQSGPTVALSPFNPAVPSRDQRERLCRVAGKQALTVQSGKAGGSPTPTPSPVSVPSGPAEPRSEGAVRHPWGVSLPLLHSRGSESGAVQEARILQDRDSPLADARGSVGRFLTAQSRAVAP